MAGPPFTDDLTALHQTAHRGTISPCAWESLITSGWAVAVTASADHLVVHRRRIELIEPGLPPAPIHHEGGPHVLHQRADPLDDAGLASLVSEVRASVVRATSAAMDELTADVPEPIASMAIRAWPADFPDDIAVQRRVPYESRADSVYLRVLAELADERGVVRRYDAKTVEAEAARVLGERTYEVLDGPRARQGATVVEGPPDRAGGDDRGVLTHPP